MAAGPTSVASDLVKEKKGRHQNLQNRVESGGTGCSVLMKIPVGRKGRIREIQSNGDTGLTHSRLVAAGGKKPPVWTASEGLVYQGVRRMET